MARGGSVSVRGTCPTYECTYFPSLDNSFFAIFDNHTGL